MNTSDNPATKIESEELRHVILEILVHRHPATLATHVIARHARTELGRSIPANTIESVLEFLKDLNFAATVLDPFGATRYWSATATGVLHQERR